MVRPVVRPHLTFSAACTFAAFTAFTLAFASACGDLKTATPAEGDGGAGSSGSSGTSGSSGSSGTDPNGPKPTENIPPGNGPGMHGSLPSGYCCTDDAQCRDRHCATVGGARMCEDACRSESTCQSRNVTFKCSSPNIGDDGWCEPPAAGFTCIAQALFKRGTRAAGECCAATGDGNAGEECDGNKCISLGMNGNDGPFVCSLYCDLTRDCPSGTICGPFHSCDPANFPYTCK